MKDLVFGKLVFIMYVQVGRKHFARTLYSVPCSRDSINPLMETFKAENPTLSGEWIFKPDAEYVS